MGRKGFTLIELLVVIAVIAILAALLFPVFLKAKERAMTAKCMAHGSEIGKAMLMYMADNGDRWPGGKLSPEAQAYLNSITWYYDWEGYQWPQARIWHANPMKHYYLRPYVKNMDIWICPDPNTMYAKRYAYGYRVSWCGRGADNFVNGDRGFVYYAQDPEFPNDSTKTIPVGRTIAEVQALDALKTNLCGARYMPPSKKIIFMCYALGRWAGDKCNVGESGYPWIWPSYAHGDGSVFVYADGHAAWKKMGMGWAPLGYTNLEIDQHQ